MLDCMDADMRISLVGLLVVAIFAGMNGWVSARGDDWPFRGLAEPNQLNTLKQVAHPIDYPATALTRTSACSRQF
jgi:hypothetical protein